ncbi:hypothetical protein SNEBB_002884 [Seison nebaliae]|nr:hypothetical protein SNEBB_002884 [Seison nebaliae]
MTRIIQVTNIPSIVQLDQFTTLFKYFGSIQKSALYPTSEAAVKAVSTRVGYIKYDKSESAFAALHLNNTIFLIKPLIVSLVKDSSIPNETVGCSYCAPIDSSIKLLPGGITWPSTVTNQLIQINNVSVIRTVDPQFTPLNLPQYPDLDGSLNGEEAEKLRRTIYFQNIAQIITLQQFYEYISQIGDVKHIRFAGDTDSPTKSCYVEFVEQSSIYKALCLNGHSLCNYDLQVGHTIIGIKKPSSSSQIIEMKSMNGNESNDGNKPLSQRNHRKSDEDEINDDELMEKKRHHHEKKRNRINRSPDVSKSSDYRRHRSNHYDRKDDSDSHRNDSDSQRKRHKRSREKKSKKSKRSIRRRSESRTGSENSLRKYRLDGNGRKGSLDDDDNLIKKEDQLRSKLECHFTKNLKDSTSHNNDDNNHDDDDDLNDDRKSGENMPINRTEEDVDENKERMSKLHYDGKNDRYFHRDSDSDRYRQERHRKKKEKSKHRRRHHHHHHHRHDSNSD